MAEHNELFNAELYSSTGKQTTEQKRLTTPPRLHELFNLALNLEQTTQSSTGDPLRGELDRQINWTERQTIHWEIKR